MLYGQRVRESIRTVQKTMRFKPSRAWNRRTASSQTMRIAKTCNLGVIKAALSSRFHVASRQNFPNMFALPMGTLNFDGWWMLIMFSWSQDIPSGQTWQAGKSCSRWDCPLDMGPSAQVLQGLPHRREPGPHQLHQLGAGAEDGGFYRRPRECYGI